MFICSVTLYFDSTEIVVNKNVFLATAPSQISTQQKVK